MQGNDPGVVNHGSYLSGGLGEPRGKHGSGLPKGLVPDEGGDAFVEARGREFAVAGPVVAVHGVYVFPEELEDLWIELN
jgi:hypothetical protein